MPPTENGCAIILVDDDERLLMTTAKLLRRAGYGVTTAIGSEQAIELLQADEEGVEVAVLDLSMPGKDGLETLVELRRIRPDLKAVLVSGYTSSALSKSDVAIDVFLRKPYLSAKLIEAIESCRKGGTSK